MRRKGYSIIEILVVIGIIVTLTTAVYGTTARTQRNFAFSVAYNDLLQIVREARDMALSGRYVEVVDVTDIDKDKDITEKIQTLPLGYAVELDTQSSPQKVRLYKDLPGTTKYKFDSLMGIEDVLIREIEIDPRFKMSLNKDGITANKIQFYYEPPYGFANFEDKNLKVAKVFLEDKETSSVKKGVMVHRVSGVPEPL